MFNISTHNGRITKSQTINILTAELYCLLNAILSLEDKLLTYKVMIKHIWTYGIQLRGSASKLNILLMQNAQSKILRLVGFSALRPIRHDDFGIEFIDRAIKKIIQIL